MPVFPSVRNAPVATTGETIFADAACTQKASITTVAGIPIPNSKIDTGRDGLRPQFVSTLPVVYVRNAGFVTALYPDIASTAAVVVTGAKGGNAALTSLIAALVAVGIPITDSTT